MTTDTPITEHLSSIKDVSMMIGEVIGIFVIGLGVGIVGALRKKKLHFNFCKAEETKFVQTHSQIHELLTELRITIRACRCLVFQFHNGGSFADGTSIKRFSVTHESCETAIQSMIVESQDVLLTRYMDVVRIMEEQGGVIIRTDSLPQSSFRSGLEINSVEYFSVVPLKFDDGLTPLGFLCCHWCSSAELDEIDREGVSEQAVGELIKDSARAIQSHLTQTKRKKR
jgi:hypothetical protein